MKARLPISSKQRKRLQQEALAVCKAEVERQKDIMSRRIIKLFCYALNEHYHFGHDRLEQLILKVSELIIEGYDDEIFWEHIDRNLIDRLKLELERDYTDEVIK